MLSGICRGVIGLPRGFYGRTLLGYKTLRAAGTAGSGDSLKTRFTPNAVDGDIYIYGAAVSGAYAVNLRQNGTFYFDAGGDESEQSLQVDLLSISSGLDGEGTFAINDDPPRVNTASGTFLAGATLILGQPISEQLQAIDPDGDTITFAVSGGSLFTGGSLSSSGLLTGTPTAYGAFGFDIKISDPFNAFTVSAESVTVISILPDFSNELAAAANAQLAAIGLSAATATSVASTLPVNTVIPGSQSPPANAVISSGATAVTFQISNGSLFTTQPNLFPTALDGLTLDSTRTVEFSTSYQGTIPGKVTTLSYTQYPIIHWDLTYEILDQTAAQDELKQIEGLFNAKQAQAGTFLYLDPIFNTVVAEPFGTGDGTTKTFQLIAAYGNPGGPSTPEIIQQLQAPATVQIFNNGSLVSTSAYSISGAGKVTFTSAPAGGHAMTWSGGFYYLAQFETDDLTPEQFLNNLWELRSLTLKSVLT